MARPSGGQACSFSARPNCNEAMASPFREQPRFFSGRPNCVAAMTWPYGNYAAYGCDQVACSSASAHARFYYPDTNACQPSLLPWCLQPEAAVYDPSAQVSSFAEMTASASCVAVHGGSYMQRSIPTLAASSQHQPSAPRFVFQDDVDDDESTKIPDAHDVPSPFFGSTVDDSRPSASDLEPQGNHGTRITSSTDDNGHDSVPHVDLVVINIPGFYTEDMVRRELSNGELNEIYTLKLRQDGRANVGCCFVRFQNMADAISFRERWAGHRIHRLRKDSSKPGRVRPLLIKFCD